MVYEIQQTKEAAPLFESWQETIIWSCLQKVMGHIYATSPVKPESAMALLGDFCFLAGKPDRELVSYKPADCCQDFMIMVPGGEGWEEVIKDCYGEKAQRGIRYAMKKEPDVFCREKLRDVVKRFEEDKFRQRENCESEFGEDEFQQEKHPNKNGYKIKMIDEELFWQCRATEWCRDWVALYPDYETYQKYGIGVVIMKGREIVAGASSYSSYHGGIEIEIDTKEAYRRQGLAYVCGAKLILECLERGWYPSWDAQNPWSAALAQKLGYHFDYEYTVYEIWGY